MLACSSVFIWFIANATLSDCCLSVMVVAGHTTTTAGARSVASVPTLPANHKLEYPFWNFYMGTVRMALAVGSMAEKDSENDQQRHENSHLISPSP
jgi:hypothetical protein